MATISPPAEWSTDQALLPEAEVDYFWFSTDRNKGMPISTRRAGIQEIDLVSAGSGYADGSYNGVDLVSAGGAVGLFATIDIQWLGGSIAFIVVQNSGQAYKVGDLLTVNAADVGGTGSGLTFRVGQVF